jgi:hypothetical protein
LLSAPSLNKGDQNTSINSRNENWRKKIGRVRTKKLRKVEKENETQASGKHFCLAKIGTSSRQAIGAHKLHS